MYYHKAVFSRGCRLETTEQQRCHITEAKNELIHQELNRKKREGKVRLVRSNVV